MNKAGKDFSCKNDPLWHQLEKFLKTDSKGALFRLLSISSIYKTAVREKKMKNRSKEGE